MSRGRTPTGRRVGIVAPTLAGGGVERFSLTIAAELIRRGHEVDLVLERFLCDYQELPESRIFYLVGSDGDERSDLGRYPLAERAEPLVRGRYPFRIRYPRLFLAPVLSWSQKPLLTRANLPRWAAAIAAYLDRERPHALLANLVPPVTAATMAARASRHQARIVGVLHNAMKGRRRLDNARRSFSKVHTAIGVSRGVSADLTEMVGVPADRVQTVYPPVTSSDLVRNANRPAGHPWIDRPGPPVVLAAGRMTTQKDFPTLLAAFARVLAHRPARLIVLGEGYLQPTLAAQAEELGLCEHVDFPGFVQNPYAFMAKAGVFALSSRHEGMPAVLIEAMACGCPVVSTDCPHGPEEILEGGRWGALVPVGDARALSEALLCALDRPAPREALRKRASDFDIDRIVTRYEAILFDGM